MSAATGGTRRFACVAPARAWPYLAAAALVVGALAAVAHVGRRAAELPGWSAARVLVLFIAVAAAAVVVRLGAELQWRVRVERDRLVFERGSQRRTLPLDSIVQLGWQPVGSSRRALISGMTIDDEQDRVWRVPGAIDGGAALIDALVEACDRDEIATWCEALRLRRRMARVWPRVTLAYVALLAWVVAVLSFVAG